MDGKGRIEANAAGVFAQQSGAHAVEGARPGKTGAHQAGMAGRYLRCDALDPSCHFVCCATGEGEQQDAPGVGAVGEQVGHAVGERAGLPGTRAGDDQEGRG